MFRRVASAFAITALAGLLQLTGGGAATRVYYNTSLGTQSSYLVVAPTGYDWRDPVTRFPIIHVFHGKASAAVNAETAVRSRAQTAMANGNLPPCILVFHEGGDHGWYANNLASDADPKGALALSWRTWVREAIAHVESRVHCYRTRDKRALFGFSMGGFGALSLAFDAHPSIGMSVGAITNCVIAYSMPRCTHAAWDSPDDVVFQEVFGNDPTQPANFAKFLATCPSDVVATNSAALIAAGRPTIRLAVGATDTGTKVSVDFFAAALDALSGWGPSSYVYHAAYAGIGHSWTGVLDAEIALAAAPNSQPWLTIRTAWGM